MRRLLILAAIALPNAVQAQSWPTLYESETVLVETFGYLRSGFGVREGGDRQVCFQLPDAPVKYRLGNECETYIEPGVTLTFGDRDAGPTVLMQFRGAIIGTPINDYDDWEYLGVEAWAALDDFAQTGPLSGARVWAGQRFYYRQDTHIHDFFYFNATGMGAGIEQIPLGFGQLALAWFEHSEFDVETALDEGSPYRRFEARIEDAQLGENTTFRSALDLRFAKDDEDTVADTGGMATIEMDREGVLQGTLTLAAQTGWGAGHQMRYFSDAEADSNEVGGRLVATHLTNRGDGDFSMMATAVLEAQSHDREWVSVGARPIWRLSGDFHGALEMGLDATRNDGDTQVLGKLTAALLWKPGGPDFFDRPSFRAYVTAADWNDDAEDAGIAPEYGGTSGFTAGVQVEHFW